MMIELPEDNPCMKQIHSTVTKHSTVCSCFKMFILPWVLMVSYIRDKHLQDTMCASDKTEQEYGKSSLCNMYQNQVYEPQGQLVNVWWRVRTWPRTTHDCQSTHEKEQCWHMKLHAVMYLIFSGTHLHSYGPQSVWEASIWTEICISQNMIVKNWRISEIICF